MNKEFYFTLFRSKSDGRSLALDPDAMRWIPQAYIHEDWTAGLRAPLSRKITVIQIQMQPT